MALVTSIVAAHILGVSTEHLRKLSKENKISHYRSAHGGPHSRFYYDEADLTAYMNSRGAVKRVPAKVAK